MSAKWFRQPHTNPVNNWDCWVRTYQLINPPFLATWDNVTNEWVEKTYGYRYPVWAIYSWRYANGMNATLMTPEVAQYINGLATPLSQEQKTKLNLVVYQVKQAGGLVLLSQAFDYFYLLGGETEESSLRNLSKNSFHLTTGDSPSWTAFEGFQGNGSSQYLLTGYIPSTQAVAMSQDSGSIGVFARNTLTHASAYHGSRSGGFGTAGYRQGRESTATNKQYGILNAPGSVVQAILDNSPGMHSWTRRNSSEIIYQKNGSDIDTLAQTSTGLSTKEVALFCTNAGGTLASYANEQFSMIYCSAGISEELTIAVYESINQYLTSYGKGI